LARKILLADDSVTAQNMGRKILTDAGYEVVTVNNGSAALKKIAEGKPDLIVLDVYMPGYSGLEVCQRIKENRETARIPILLTVGKLEPFKPEEARRARADAFVVKPFEASELLSALTKLEDKIIPGAEPYKQGRFAKAIASVDQEPDGEKFGDSEGGWKARLRIPTGKPKEKDTEPDPDYASTQGKGFRDLPETATKKNAPTPPVVAPMPERPLPSGIPHDITPEEIAAITAAAAQLNGTATAPDVEPHETNIPESTVAETAQEVVAQDNDPVTFASSPALADPVDHASDVQTAAVSHLDSAQPEAVAETVAAELLETPTGAKPEIPSATVPPTEAVVEEPAISPTARPEVSPVEASVEEVAPVPVAEADESRAVMPVIAAPETAVADVPSAPAIPEPAAEVAATQSSAASTSDDEVMAALQTLIPSSETAAVATVDPSNGTGTTYPAHSAHPRWVAEEVGLAVDEATISLEQEMATAYSTFSGQAAHSADTATAEPSVAQAEVTVAAPAPEPEPEAFEPPGVEALASAAAVGEGASAYSTVSVQASPESLTTEQPAEITTSTSEVHSAAASSTAEPVAEAIHTIEGEVMAASWKNIRDSIAGAAARPAATKEEFRDVEPAPVEPNSVAPLEPSTRQFKASDPTSIANIVDSVLAELRPKIVEEIARKLADSKKE